MVEYVVMHFCSLAWGPLAPVNVEHNNGDDDGDDCQADDHDIYHGHY